VTNPFGRGGCAYVVHFTSIFLVGVGPGDPSKPREDSGGTTRTETSLSGLTRTENLNKEPNCVRISTQPEPANSESTGATTGATFTRYLPTDSANTYIRNALLNADATKDVQVAGVGTTKTGYVIRFKDHQSAETARTNTEWLEELGNGTKLIKPRFGVVVHRVPTVDFSIPGNEKDGIARIMEENDLAAKGYRVDEISQFLVPLRYTLDRLDCNMIIV
jgi:hypothetical protein